MFCCLIFVLSLIFLWQWWTLIPKIILKINISKRYRGQVISNWFDTFHHSLLFVIHYVYCLMKLLRRRLWLYFIISFIIRLTYMFCVIVFDEYIYTFICFNILSSITETYFIFKILLSFVIYFYHLYNLIDTCNNEINLWSTIHYLSSILLLFISRKMLCNKVYSIYWFFIAGIYVSIFLLFYCQATTVRYAVISDIKWQITPKTSELTVYANLHMFFMA